MNNFPPMKPAYTASNTDNLSLQASQLLSIFNDINRELKRGGIVLTLTTTESDWIPSQADDDYRLDPVKVGEFVTAYMQALEARQN